MTPEPQPVPGTPRSPRRWLRFAPLAILLAVTAALFASGAHEWLTLETIAAQQAALLAWVAERPLVAPALYLAAYALAVSLSLPGAWWFTTIGGFLFGWAAGAALAVLGATAGASMIFLAARSSFADLLIRRAGPTLQKLVWGFRRDAFSYLLALRLIPLFPFWLVNLAPALVGVRLRTFVAATLIGVIPGTLAFAVAGDGLGTVIAGRQAAYEACLAQGRQDCRLSLAVGDLVTPELLIGLGLLGLLSIVSLLLKARLSKRSEAPDATNPAEAP